MNKTNKKTIYTMPFIFLLAFLLLEYGKPQTYFPIMGAIRPGVIIIGLLLISLAVNLKRLYFRNIEVKFFLALLLLMTLHVPMAKNNYHAYLTWYIMVTYFIVFLSIINFIDSSRKVEQFINIWIIIIVVCAILGILNRGYVPGGGSLDDENDFALVMNMTIPLSYFMLLISNSIRSKLFLIISVILFTAASVLSFSRGGFIGLAVAFLYCWWKSPSKIIGSILVFLVVILVFSFAPVKYFEEIKSIKEENIHGGTGTGAIRWYYWQRGWLMFLDNPLIGVGQGNFPWRIQEYEPPEGFVGRHHGSMVAHSIYFTLIAELGIIGVITFVGILIYSLRDMKFIEKLKKKKFIHNLQNNVRNEKDENRKMVFIGYGIFGAILAYLTTGIFLSVLYYPHFWVLTALIISIRNVAKNKIDTGIE